MSVLYPFFLVGNEASVAQQATAMSWFGLAEFHPFFVTVQEGQAVAVPGISWFGTPLFHGVSVAEQQIDWQLLAEWLVDSPITKFFDLDT